MIIDIYYTFVHKLHMCVVQLLPRSNRYINKRPRRVFGQKFLHLTSELFVELNYFNNNSTKLLQNVLQFESIYRQYNRLLVGWFSVVTSM